MNAIRKAFSLCLGAALLCGSAQGQDYELFVSDGATPAGAADWKILRYDASGGNPRTFIDQRLNWPQDLLFLEQEGVVLVSNLNSGVISRHSIDDGSYIDNFALGIFGPTRMRFGPDGTIYVLQWNGNAPVLRFQRDGSALGAFTSRGVNRAIGIDWDAEGNLYVSSYSEDLVRRFDPQGNDLGIFAATGLDGPTDVWFDDQGNLLVLNFNSNSVAKFSPTGQPLGAFVPSLGRPEGIARLPNGNVLIGEGSSGSVREYDQSGGFQGVRVAPGAGGLVRPNAIVVRQAPSAPVISINPGLNDAWFNPETAGQGLFINVFPDAELMFVGWFTFEAASVATDEEEVLVGAPEHRWLTATGAWEGNRATLDVTNTRGGLFDDDQPVSNSEPGGYGAIEIEFHDCRSATMTYDLFSIGLSGTMPIRRIASDNVALCEALSDS